VYIFGKATYDVCRHIVKYVRLQLEADRINGVWSKRRQTITSTYQNGDTKSATNYNGDIAKADNQNGDNQKTETATSCSK